MLRRTVLIAVAILAACAVPAQAKVERACGDIGTLAQPDAPQAVKALHTSCRTARRVARKHWHRIGDGERCDLSKKSCTLGAWTCRRTFFGNSGTRVRCAAAERRVRFFYGV
jgi:hypothetical protein